MTSSRWHWCGVALVAATVTVAGGCQAIEELFGRFSGDETADVEQESAGETAGDESSRPICGAPDFPCTWAEVSTAVQDRTKEVATDALQARFDGDAPSAIAAKLRDEADVSVLWADEHTIRYRVD